MAKYRVTVEATEIYNNFYIVEAKSEEEAKAKYMYGAFDSGEYVDTDDEFVVSVEEFEG